MTTLIVQDEPACHGIGAVSDARSVVERAMQLLDEHDHYRGRVDQFALIYRSGDQSLTVRGSVPTFHLRFALELALRGLPGVHRIDNRVDVVCAHGLSSERPTP